LSVFLFLAAASAMGRPIEGRCEIRFFGSSTLKDFSGTATSETFVVEAPDGVTNLQQVGEFVVRVPVRGLDTGHAAMNRKMHEMFREPEHPLIAGAVDRQGGSPGPADAEPRLGLRITICGVERTLPARVTRVERSGDQAAVDLEFEVSLKAFGLKPPSLLGVLRVRDAVRVQVRLAMKAAPRPDVP